MSTLCTLSLFIKALEFVFCYYIEIQFVVCGYTVNINMEPKLYEYSLSKLYLKFFFNKGFVVNSSIINVGKATQS